MTGWDTRAQSGLRAPRAISTQINPTHGVAMHYGGGGPFKRSKHADCRTIWRAWQAWHMSPANKNNYNDIAYNLGVCHHDIVLEGRSTRTRPKIRGGANGNFTVNGNRYSVVAIWGSNDGAWPDSLKRAWRFARDWLRQQDSRTGTGLTPHSAMANTSCPGGPGRTWLAAGAPIPVKPPPPPKKEWWEMSIPNAEVNKIADKVVEKLTFNVGKGTTLDQLGIFAAGRTLNPASQGAYAWGYSLDNRRTLRTLAAHVVALRAAVGEFLEHDTSNPLTKADLEAAIEAGMRKVQIEVSVVEDDTDEDS